MAVHPDGKGIAVSDEHRTQTATPSRLMDAERSAAWLESEFPGWTIEIDRTATWEGTLKPLWIARREGHHPQSEMTAAKLHTRLTDYLAREERRRADSN